MLLTVTVAAIVLTLILCSTAVWIAVSGDRRVTDGELTWRRSRVLAAGPMSLTLLGLGVVCLSVAVALVVLPSMLRQLAEPSSAESAPVASVPGDAAGSGRSDQQVVDELPVDDRGVREIEEPAEVDSTSSEDLFLALVRDDLPADTVLAQASDADLLSFGREACSRRTDADPESWTQVVDGSPADGLVVFNAAVRSLCV